MPKLVTICLFAAAVLLSAVTSAMFTAGLPSPAVASSAGRSQGTPIDPSQGYLSSISCPTATFCVAVDFHGNVLTYNGSSWSSPDSIDPGTNLMSVSCPTASFCAAVDFAGHVLTYNDSSWSSPKLIDWDTPLESVSCPSASFCAAVDNTGPHVLTYNGSSWSLPDRIDTSGSILTSISCPTATFCVAVDFHGNFLTYNGSSWSSPDSIDPSGGGLNSVSCPTASFCVAVDQNGNVLTYNGSLWSSPDSINFGYAFLTSVSCPTANFCAAVDGRGDIFTYNGSAWSSFNTIDPSGVRVNSVSCPTASFCAAVDAIGNAFTYSPPAASKTTLGLSAAKVTYGDEQVEQLSVTVSPQFSGSTPSGTVTVNESSTTLCTITLSGAKGSCTLTPNQIKAGTYSLVATYGGSTNFEGSTSSKETFTVAEATTMTALKLSVTNVTYGDERVERLSVAVSPQFSGSRPTGKVMVKASTQTLCVITLSSGKGSCRLSPNKLKAGTQSLVATYGGSTNFEGSTSSKETLTVVKS